MENRSFGTTSFYHIPAGVFENPGAPGNPPSEKTVHIEASAPDTNVTNLVACFVIKYCNPGDICRPLQGYCDRCSECPWVYYCMGDNPPPEIPGGSAPPGGTPPSTPPSGGGGSGGGSCSTCPLPPVECRLPFYVEDPCGPPQGPLPPEAPPYFTLVDVDADSVSNPCVAALIDQLSMPALNSYLVEFYQNPSLPGPHNDKIKIKFLEDTTLTGTSGNLIPGRTHLNILPDSTKEIRITLNPKYMKTSAKEFISTVILHELAHGIYSILYPGSTEDQHHEGILNGGAGLIGKAIKELYPNLSVLHAISLGLSGIDGIILAPNASGGFDIKADKNQTAINIFGVPLEVTRPISLTYINGTDGNPC